MDSGDDNESERNSNFSQQNTQNSGLQSLSMVQHTKNVEPTTFQTRKLSNGNYHRGHLFGSISANASPITVAPNLKELNYLQTTPKFLQQSHNTSTATTSNHNDNVQQYFNIMANRQSPSHVSNVSNGLMDQQNSSPNQLQISNLDLINGVENGNTITALNRQMRLRAYGNNKSGNFRHETKL